MVQTRILKGTIILQMQKYKRVLSIAGSDSGGGAGIQADIKAISATGSYAASAITAVTVQNTVGVQAVFPVPVEIISAQIDAVLQDIGADAVKIGMLHSPECVNCVADSLLRNQAGNIVLDPVMVSTSGHTLLMNEAVAVLKERLMPIATIITPNIPEAEALSGEKVEGIDDMRRVAKSLSQESGTSVLLKGGHLKGEKSVDILYNYVTSSFRVYESDWIDTRNTHGTGCTLSSAIASYLAQGLDLEDAVKLAKDYLTRALVSGSGFSIGKGSGPVNHFYDFK